MPRYPRGQGGGGSSLSGPGALLAIGKLDSENGLQNATKVVGATRDTLAGFTIGNPASQLITFTTPPVANASGLRNQSGIVVPLTDVYADADLYTQDLTLTIFDFSSTLTNVGVCAGVTVGADHATSRGVAGVVYGTAGAGSDGVRTIDSTSQTAASGFNNLEACAARIVADDRNASVIAYPVYESGLARIWFRALADTAFQLSTGNVRLFLGAYINGAVGAAAQTSFRCQWFFQQSITDPAGG